VVYASEIMDPGFVDVARIEEGGAIGELALVDGKPRMCTTKALTRLHLIVINKHEFLKA
jgi:CRP-like cAMP-binding protein